MAGEDRRYLEWIRRQPCCSCGVVGSVEAHHMTGAGMSMKANDHEAMPLCTKCHRAFHDASGDFRFMGKERRRTWQHEQVLACLKRFVTRPTDPEAEDAF